MNGDDLVKKYEQMFGISFEAMEKVPKIHDDYKARAKRNNLEFAIPFTAFDYLLKQPCYFCKVKKDMDVAGIDRADNSKGYVSGNCLPCCWDCNRAKSNQTMKEFCDYLKRFNPNLEVSEDPVTLHWSRNPYG